MAKNKLSDLRDHLFQALERLSDEELTKEEKVLEMEVKKANAITEISKVLIESAKVEVMAIKAAGGTIEPSKFLTESTKSDQ